MYKLAWLSLEQFGWLHTKYRHFPFPIFSETPPPPCSSYGDCRRLTVATNFSGNWNWPWLNFMVATVGSSHCGSPSRLSVIGHQYEHSYTTERHATHTLTPAYAAQPCQLSTQRQIWNEPSLKAPDSHSHSCIKNINPSPPPYYVCPYKWFGAIPQHTIHDGIADLQILKIKVDVMLVF